MIDSVTLVVNTYQKTMDRVLTPGFFKKLVRQNCRNFDETVVLINNVENPSYSRELAGRLIASGEISAFHEVSDLLPNALKQVSLQYSDLGRLSHYSDCLLAACFAVNTKFLLYWDAEVMLNSPVDWVGPAVEILNERSDVFVVSPRPDAKVPERSVGETDEFIFNYGFSDQLLLVRSEDLRQPIYQERCPASLRYPTSHICLIVEQRLDSHMRNKSRKRALFKGAVYLHEGSSSYRPKDFGELVHFMRNRAVSRSLKLQPVTASPRWKV